MVATASQESVVPALLPGDCLFVDVDGTLVDFRDDPQIVRADAALLALLRRCADRLGGALALISGRPIADLDLCFAPERFAASGIHGLERRDARGFTTYQPSDRTTLRFIAQQFSRSLPELPLVQLEDKGASLALHWRRAPRHALAVRQLAAEALRVAGPEFRLLEGNCVIELLPTHVHKGQAVLAFLQEEPFHGRRPVCLGDDITDLPGFEVAQRHGGHGIAVGTRVAADYRMQGVAAVRQWLAGGTDG
jgi:trehalose 6-phosphate phosphatase